jgi:hypothetical protein
MLMNFSGIRLSLVLTGIISLFLRTRQANILLPRRKFFAVGPGVDNKSRNLFLSVKIAYFRPARLFGSAYCSPRANTIRRFEENISPAG